MKIQIITANDIGNTTNIQVNSFANPESLDVYDVNIFDLRNNFWKNDADNTTTVNLTKDIKHIKKMIETAINKKNIIVLPQNSAFKYYYHYKSYNGPKNYLSEEDLKNCLSVITKITRENFLDYEYLLGYEPNKTIIQNKNYKSDFYFINKSEEISNVISKANKSNKDTSLKIQDGMIITTLDILEEDLLENYLINIGFLDNEKNVPEWINTIDILNDKDLKKEKKLKEEEIIIINKSLKEIELSLSKNNEYKSILYETGANLTNEVNKILGDIFDVSVDKFNDICEEDFLIKLSNITFVVEIKGVVHNVTGRNVSEAFNHIQVYLDEVLEHDKEEKVKGLLIVANQREISPGNRVAINERQVKIAKRNDILIIKTEDLLKIYEKYLNKELTVTEIVELFDNNVGLLNIEQTKNKN